MSNPKRRPVVWLIAAAILLVIAALLLRPPDDERAQAAQAAVKDVEFPRHMDIEARQRVTRRRTFTVTRTSPDAGSAAVATDPLLAALAPRGLARTTVIVEANALVHSSIGQAMMECLSGTGDLEEMQRTTGLDVQRDIDRVAYSDGVTLVSGQFSALQIPIDTPPVGYGDHGRIWDEGDGAVVARWKDELVLFGESRAEVEAAIDRLEAGGAGEPALREDETYGEIYGSIDPAMFAELLPPEIAAKLGSVARGVKLHVDADEDVGMVVDIDGEQGAALEELARSVGGALALGRIDAARQGRKEMADLLDYARVITGSDGFRLELALPRSWLEENVLARCRERGSAMDGDRGDGGSTTGAGLR